MKVNIHKGWLWAVVATAFASLWAAPVTCDQARTAAGNWLRSDPALGCRLGRSVGTLPDGRGAVRLPGEPADASLRPSPLRRALRRARSAYRSQNQRRRQKPKQTLPHAVHLFLHYVNLNYTLLCTLVNRKSVHFYICHGSERATVMQRNSLYMPGMSPSTMGLTAQ